jgi:hypothetical protein
MSLQNTGLFFLVVLILLSVSFPMAAGTTLGLALERNYSDGLNRVGGFLRTGGLFKLELGGIKPIGESGEKIELFSYLLTDLVLSNFGTSTGSLHMYLGASPVMSLTTDRPSFSFSTSEAYGKLGLQFKIFPFSLGVWAKGKLGFNGDIKKVLAGAGFGFSF